jgi:hypothetical protein
MLHQRVLKKAQKYDNFIDLKGQYPKIGRDTSCYKKYHTIAKEHHSIKDRI